MKFSTERKIKRTNKKFKEIRHKVIMHIAKKLYNWAYAFYVMVDPWEGPKRTTIRIKLKR